MIDLPELKGLDVGGKSVMVRADLDLPANSPQTTDYSKNVRLMSLIPTLRHLHGHGAKKIILIGHRGRPKPVDSRQTSDFSEEEKKLSLEPVSKVLEKMLTEELGEEEMKKLDMHVMENLRFNEGEEKNDEHFAEHLAEQADIYVNEAFAVSHRKHASVVKLPQIIKSRYRSLNVAVGLRFQEEIEQLSKIIDNPKTPVLAVISGVKEDKLSYVEPFLKFADKVLIAGRLPDYFDRSLKSEVRSPSLVVARLLPDKEDITVHSVEKFENEIKSAGTIVVSGTVGKFEEEGHRQGTERVFKAVVENKSAFKVAGGGDTESAIQLLNLIDGFDWISVGGGSMLEFLAKGTLPGIEALIN
jgi:phosphoglycerate kinase